MRRTEIAAQGGFTLIELLTVLVILGMLAAIAVPSFLDQRSKAQDACVKSALVSARTAMETYYTDHGNYLGVDASALHQIENTIPTGGACNSGYSLTIGDAGSGDCTGTAGAPSFCVGLRSVAGPGRPYVLNRYGNGRITHVCGSAAGGVDGGGCTNGSW